MGSLPTPLPAPDTNPSPNESSAREIGAPEAWPAPTDRAVTSRRRLRPVFSAEVPRAASARAPPAHGASGPQPPALPGNAAAHPRNPPRAPAPARSPPLRERVPRSAPSPVGSIGSEKEGAQRAAKACRTRNQKTPRLTISGGKRKEERALDGAPALQTVTRRAASATGVAMPEWQRCHSIDSTERIHPLNAATWVHSPLP